LPSETAHRTGLREIVNIVLCFQTELPQLPVYPETKEITSAQEVLVNLWVGGANRFLLAN
jgi:hypothetical protein